MSLQPNAGSQGEFAGLLAIRGLPPRARRGAPRRLPHPVLGARHERGERGAWPACGSWWSPATSDGNVDLADLAPKIDEHGDRLAAIMVTYPSTHGVFEETITEICARVHEAGGQVYVDGANLNALVGLARPGEFGADVSHLNLHKTFCIPHGGGGPGVGPVAVRAHLAPYLPGHPLRRRRRRAARSSAAPYGSASILPISWAYMRMMGAEGLRRATEQAILSANYIARRLAPHYPVLYTGRGGLVAHECIIDLRQITKADRRHRRGRGQAADRLRLPRADHVVPGGRHAHDRADRERGPRRARPVLRGDDRDPAGDRAGRLRRATTAPTTRCATRRTPPRRSPPTSGTTPTAGPRPPTRWRGCAATSTGRRCGRIDQAYGDRNLVCACPPPQAFED